MTQTVAITEADIRALASGESIDRGYAYYQSGSVSDLVRRGNLLSARVEGSEYEPYQVQVTLSEAGIVNTSCTCPYDWGGICKHIVAVLLALIHNEGAIEEKPSLETLLAGLSAEQLRQALLGLAARDADIVEAIEREVGLAQKTPAAGAAASVVPIQADINAIYREIDKDFRQSSGARQHRDSWYYDEYEGMEIDPTLIIQPHLERVQAFLDAGDVETAAAVISATIEAFADGVAEMDESVYEYNEDVFHEAVAALGAALAEVLLTLEMTPDEREDWEAQIGDWGDQLGDLDIALTALEQGWDYAPLVSAMQGNITEKGAWEDEPPDYADELALARLRILARQGRTAEYINLAEAEGQTKLAVLMRAETGEFARVVADAKAYLSLPQEILSVARRLAEKGQIEAALDVAAHGLTLEQQTDKTELARWTREQAMVAQRPALALQAAQAAFIASNELRDYKVVQELAGAEWTSLKPGLLRSLRGGWNVSNRIDIYLYEDMLEEAMRMFDQETFGYDHDLLRVIDAARAAHPDWCIRQCQKKGEVIMNAGKAQSYDVATSWLQRAHDIYKQHNRLPEWQQYLGSVLTTHQRKYKLVPMLRGIR